MKKQLLSFAAAMTVSMTAQAGYSQDVGHIVEIFTNTEGAVALRLDTGFTNAIAAKQCPTGDGNWAGVSTADPIFKAAILMAKSKGSQVVVTTEGCAGGWLKISDIYIR